MWDQVSGFCAGDLAGSHKRGPLKSEDFPD